MVTVSLAHFIKNLIATVSELLQRRCLRPSEISGRGEEFMVLTHLTSFILAVVGQGMSRIKALETGSRNAWAACSRIGGAAACR